MMLADALFRSLGRCSAQQYLLNTLAQSGVRLHRNSSDSSAGGNRYPIAASELGFTLMMEPVPVEGSESLLGLHSVCISASSWSGPWFKGIDPLTVTPQEVINVLAVDPLEALVTSEMACFTIQGVERQMWSVVVERPL